MSVGGGDTSVMVWHHGGVGESHGESDDSDTDSEEEGGKYMSVIMNAEIFGLNVYKKLPICIF